MGITDRPGYLEIDILGNIYVAEQDLRSRQEITYPFDLPFCFLAASLLNYRTKAMRIRRSLPGNKIAKPKSFALPNVEPGAYGAFHETLLVSSYNNDMVYEFDIETGDLLNSIAVKTPVGIGHYVDAIPEPPGAWPGFCV